jgi:hypothetical protein
VLDLTGILFSTLMMLFVVIRAVRLDATLPWFEVPPSRPAADATAMATPTPAHPVRETPAQVAPLQPTPPVPSPGRPPVDRTGSGGPEHTAGPRDAAIIPWRERRG